MTKKKSCVIYSVIGILFVFCCMTEYALSAEGNIVWNVAWIGRLTAVCMTAGPLLGCAICLGLFGLKKAGKRRVFAKPIRLPSAGRIFVLSFVCTMLCWLPAYLAYYPGIDAYDFVIQMEQINTGFYIEHHPLFHTLLMELFIRLGAYVGSGTIGFSLYILLQMSLLAAVLAGGIAVLRKKEVRGGYLIALQIFCCFFPFHWYMSISATKDTIFTVFFFWQILMLVCLLDQKKPLRFGLADAGYLLGSVGMILFRNNGRYAMAVTAVFLLLAVLFGKKERALWGKLLAETLAGLLLGSLLLSAASLATGATQGDRREMLSMPIQQLARTMIYHGNAGVLAEDDNTMGEADKALINEFILYEAYKAYRPDISDPVKRNTNTYVVVAKPKEFITTYVGLFLDYPGDYLNAALAVNAGYLSPFDETHAHINEMDGYTGLGYIQTRWTDPEPNLFQIQRDSKWPGLHKILEKFADANQYLRLPVLKYVMVPGSYLWFYLILAAWLLVHKKYRLLLPMTLVLGYYITLLLGPTVQLRYLYPVMIMLPYLAIGMLSTMKKDKKDHEEIVECTH